MNAVHWLDERGSAAWIGLLVVSFVVFWPLGLVVLFYMWRTGRMGCWKNRAMAPWSGRGGVAGEGGPGRWYRAAGFARSSGNRAFDEYREETLRRLEEEQDEFHAFLDKLRQARDKAEFDQFMADRTNRTPHPHPPRARPAGPVTRPACATRHHAPAPGRGFFVASDVNPRGPGSPLARGRRRGGVASAPPPSPPHPAGSTARS